MSAGFVVGVLLAFASVLLLGPSARSHSVVLPSSVERPGGISDAPLILDLLAAVLSSGAAVESALGLVAGSCDPRTRASLTRVCGARRLGASWESSWEVGLTEWDEQSTAGRPARGVLHRRSDASPHLLLELRQGLRFATATGAPSAGLLHAEADQLRRRHNREVDRRAAALGVQLVLPLGLCSLPAFICLGVVPVVIGLLPAL